MKYVVEVKRVSHYLKKEVKSPGIVHSQYQGPIVNFFRPILSNQTFLFIPKLNLRGETLIPNEPLNHNPKPIYKPNGPLKFVNLPRFKENLWGSLTFSHILN